MNPKPLQTTPASAASVPQASCGVRPGHQSSSCKERAGGAAAVGRARGHRAKAACTAAAPSTGSGAPGRAVRATVTPVPPPRVPGGCSLRPPPAPMRCHAEAESPGRSLALWVTLVTAAFLQERPWGWSSSLGPRALGSTAQSCLPASGLSALAPCRELSRGTGDAITPTGADTLLLPPPRSEHVTARVWPEDGPPLRGVWVAAT